MATTLQAVSSAVGEEDASSGSLGSRILRGFSKVQQPYGPQSRGHSLRCTSALRRFAVSFRLSLAAALIVHLCTLRRSCGSNDGVFPTAAADHYCSSRKR